MHDVSDLLPPGRRIGLGADAASPTTSDWIAAGASRARSAAVVGLGAATALIAMPPGK